MTLPGSSLLRVYPRVCGGALGCGGTPSADTGLSPRVRGSLRVRPGVRVKTGSIPACAGEPSPAPHVAQSYRVYPRVCGGAPLRSCQRRPTTGLSPRVRGSLCRIIDRSISVSIQLSMSGEVEFSVDRNLLTRSTPSASRISFGGSPRWRSAKPPATAPSRQIIATAPFPSVVNQSSSTAQTRSRTPDERSGDTYTPGAISSIAEARNPRYLGSTSRVTITVIDMNVTRPAATAPRPHRTAS